MKALAQLVVNVFDLIEAEGRALRTVVRGESGRMRSATANMTIGVSIMLLAVPIAVGGVALLAVSMMWGLEPMLGWPVAIGLTGVAALAVGVALLMLFAFLVRGSSS